MIQPFYFEGATVEKDRSFWDAFERATVGLKDAVRLNAFRVLLKGKTGVDWWMHSRIDDFDTLRTRFYNQFICQTPLQMIERLRNAKRAKGMSAEVWGDVISNLCDSAQVTDPQMRYQYFLTGIRNKVWKDALQTTMVNDIPRAVVTLLYKNMHLPTEDELEFARETTKKTSSKESMMQQMMGLIQQTQHLLVSQNRLLARPPRSPKNRAIESSPPFIAAMYDDQSISAVTEIAPDVSGGNHRMGPDRYTQEGLSVCGRCHFLGCSRETCHYNNMTCENCKVRGHVAFECVQPRLPNGGGNRSQQQTGQQQGSNGNNRKNSGNGNGIQQRGSGKCYLCDDPNHRVLNCPLRQTVMQLAANGAVGTKPVQGQVPAQH
ncbi:hypothetical protein PHMEG_00028435 [Phytophthora megakarya]|uniref:CCHC-type domain-containing protein n=1 Tax=Phytophthora megakarya TaxID=4795 RepID=A0A225V4Z3_9STRA|nr:hypothetical protein PHMEG_00028435 [Phytophthora megakarya]